MSTLNRIIPAKCDVVKGFAILAAAANFNGQRLAEFTLDPTLTRRKMWLHVTSGGNFPATWKIEFTYQGVTTYREEFQMFGAAGTGIGDNAPAFATTFFPAVDSFIINGNAAGLPPVIVHPLVLDPLEADKVILTGGNTTQPGGNVIFWGLRVLSLAPL